MMHRLSLLLGGESIEHDFTFYTANYIHYDLSNNYNTLWEIVSIFYLTKDNELYHLILQGQELELDMSFFINKGAKKNLAELPKLIKDDNSALFSCCQGKYGEDGHLQAMSSLYGIRSNLDSIFASAACTNKWSLSLIANKLCEEVLSQIISYYVNKSDINKVEDIIKDNSVLPCILKPNSLGGSYFVEAHARLTIPIIKNYAKKVFEYDDAFLVQKHIIADEVACCCIIIDSKIEILPLLKVNKKGALMDFNEKFKEKKYQWIFFDVEHYFFEKIYYIVNKIYNFFHFKSYVRFDFLVEGDNIYLLEINNNPGIYPGSLFYRALTKSNFELLDILNNLS